MNQYNRQISINLSLIQDNLKLKVSGAQSSHDLVGFLQEHKPTLIKILKQLPSESNVERKRHVNSEQENYDSSMNSDASEPKGLSSQLEEMVKTFNVLGCQITHLKGEKLNQYFLGYTDEYRTQVYECEQYYRLSCLMKIVLTYAALRLVDKGVFKLDIPVTKWITLPNSLPAGLTLRHLLSHSAGFDETTFLNTHAGSKDLEQFASAMINYQQMLMPGEGYIYSPSSIIFTAYLIEKALNMPWLDAINHLVFQPLDIKPCEDNDLLAKSYTRVEGRTGFRESDINYQEDHFEPSAATTIALKGSDIAKLAAIPLRKGKKDNGERFLSQALADLLTREQTSVEGNYFITGFALGWLRFSTHGLSGFITGNQGQHTCVVINSNTHEAIVAQTITQPNFEFFDQLCRMFHQCPLLKVNARAVFKNSEIVGNYAAQGLRAKVYEEAGKLKIDAVYLMKNGTWSDVISCDLLKSGMGDYYATPKVYPMQDSINFHDLTNADGVTHIRITQKLCRKK